MFSNVWVFSDSNSSVSQWEQHKVSGFWILKTNSYDLYSKTFFKTDIQIEFKTLFTTISESF